MMTDEEFEAAIKEINEHVKRTSFPALPPEDLYEEHTHHAEYGEAAH